MYCLKGAITPSSQIPFKMTENNERQNIVGIIPARGGSKGIPKKNICLLAGKPLLSYTIEAALNSNTLSKVLVSGFIVKPSFLTKFNDSICVFISSS